MTSSGYDLDTQLRDVLPEQLQPGNSVLRGDRYPDRPVHEDERRFSSPLPLGIER
jgi:hypothetical protein